MSREFSSYDDAKRYYEDMVKDRKRYGELNQEIKNLERQLAGKLIPLTTERKEDIKHEIEVYTWVRDNIARKFPQEHEVEDIKKLAAKMEKFKGELEQVERGSRWEEVHTTQQGSESSQGQEQPRKSHKEVMDAFMKGHERTQRDRDKDREHER